MNNSLWTHVKRRCVLRIALCTLLVFVVTLNGCVGYRLGSTLPSYIKTIHVPTFINKCNEPMLETETTQAAVREFQKDGTLRVTGAVEADLLLSVTLVDYDLRSLRFGKNQAKATKEYRLKITAEINCKDRLTGKVMIRKQVQGEATFEPSGDLSSAKRSALPEAARDLAHDIVENIVEAW
ncbi:LPS assembly lipoprotein LptE [Verrucomicrobiota bacterium]